MRVPSALLSTLQHQVRHKPRAAIGKLSLNIKDIKINKYGIIYWILQLSWHVYSIIPWKVSDGNTIF